MNNFYVITEPCIGTCDTACAKICPVECIHGPELVQELVGAPEPRRKIALKSLQLYIDPDACIGCGICLPECPVQAIYEESDVPLKWQSSIAKNADYFKKKSADYLNEKRPAGRAGQWR